MNDASSTPAKFARWDYLSHGTVRHSSAWEAIFAIVGRVFLGLCACLGTFVLFGAIHPVIGLVSGIALLIGIVAFKPRYGLWQGRCPHCEREITLPPGTVPGVFECPMCTKRIYLSDGYFWRPRKRA